MSGYISVCWQVKCSFALCKGKPYLVSVHIKQQRNVQAFLVQTGLPFGQGVNHSSFFATEQEAQAFAAHLRATYRGRTLPPPQGGQLSLF